jgi:hypothetical protein
MRFLLTDATFFNQPIGDWGVSNVVDLAFMFADATLYNQSLGNWNVSSDTALASIFEGSGCPGEVGQECCFDDCGFEPEVVYDCSDLLSGCSTVRHFESRTRESRVSSACYLGCRYHDPGHVLYLSKFPPHCLIDSFCHESRLSSK